MRNTCYTQLKWNTKRIKYLEKSGGRGETAAFKEKEGASMKNAQPEDRSAFLTGFLSFEKMTAIRKKKK